MYKKDFIVKKIEHNEPFFSEFPPVSREQWDDKIKKDLKGADYCETLTWETLEGVTPLPFYRREDLEDVDTGPIRSRADSSWRRCESIWETDPFDIRKAIREASDGGADSVLISCDITAGDETLGGNITGAQIHTQENFDSLFETDEAQPVLPVFDSGMASPALLAMLENHTGQTTGAVFLFDPFTYTASRGAHPLPDGKLKSVVSQMAGHKNIRSLAADGLFYHRAGATIVQELGIALAIFSEYLAAVEKNQQKKAAGSMVARLSAGPLYFPEIAKFRAMRILWENLMEAYGIDKEIPLMIHAETTPQNKTIPDAHNNMLRVTTEAMAAILGGVDSLVVTPYDELFRRPEGFSRRIARNVHHIIREEAHLTRVTDPSAGSYYIEKLTEEIARKAWDFFRMIETQGGFTKALESRMIQQQVGESAGRKMEAYATRTRVLTGTNHYPDTSEEPAEPIENPKFSDALRYTKKMVEIDSENLNESLQEHFKRGNTIGDVSPELIEPQRVLYPALKPFRPAVMFEKIRFRTLSYAREKGRKPKVALIPVGPPKWRKARASFAQNLLGCAGFDIETHAGFDSVEEAAEHFEPAEFDAAVLCSSNKMYSELAEPFCRAFNETGVKILAGNPEDMKEDYLDAGFDEFIYSGIDAAEWLTRLQDKLFETEDHQ